MKRHRIDLGKIYLGYFWQEKGRYPYYTKRVLMSQREKKQIPKRKICQGHKYKV